MRVLIIEDNKELVENVVQYLKLDGFAVDTAYDGQEGLQKAQAGEYDCIILDLNLPGIDGMEVCRQLRNESNITPILMLTARGGTANIISGLNTGADDYLTKPFDMDELTARIKSLIRRNKKSPNPTIELGDIVIDTNAKLVRQKGKHVRLSPKEYGLLEFLALNPNQVQNRVTLIEHVWGEYEELMFSQTVDVHVAYLRRKLGKKFITTGPGGYMITTPTTKKSSNTV